MQDDKESQPGSIKTSVAGMEKWSQSTAEALGVKQDDITRTSGCEVEFLVTTENKNAFRKRALDLMRGRYTGYVKEPKYMPKTLRPNRWQGELEQDKKKASLGEEQSVAATVNKHIAEYTLEPTTYMSELGVERRAIDPAAEDFHKQQDTFPQSYLTAEVVSNPISSTAETAQWLSNIGQHLLDTIDNKIEATQGQKKGHIYMDFRSKPTSATWSNSVQVHLGMRVSLEGLLNSPVFPAEQKTAMLGRNVRFYRERLEASGNSAAKEMEICREIEKACAEGISPESALKHKDYIPVIQKISVNMFSKRELEADTVIIDDNDLRTDAAKKVANTETARRIEGEERRLLTPSDKGKTRQVDKDEVSDFGLIFGRELEKFNHDCALLTAPAETSYERFATFNGAGAPHFNAAAQRKTMGVFGSYLFRGDGRISAGQYNTDAEADTGDLRVENRICCSESLGHPNHAYPNQKAMSYELMEGMEYVFANTSRKYGEYLQGKEANRITEDNLFDTYGRCVEAFPKGILPQDVIPAEQQLPRHKDAAIERFLTPGTTAEQIYGKERLAGMVERRAELDRIIYADFNPFNAAPGPQNPHPELQQQGVKVRHMQTTYAAGIGK